MHIFIFLFLIVSTIHILVIELRMTTLLIKKFDDDDDDVDDDDGQRPTFYR